MCYGLTVSGRAPGHHERGVDLYNYVSGLQPGIIINNRVDVGREGMAGMNSSSEYKGDFGTPEQEVPATGFPGAYWESCITLNNNWGYNKADNNWKSTSDVIRMLTDICSKGGNLLLNIGPKPDGTFPDQSIKTLAEIGVWMKKNGSSIYGTSASPFSNLTWGRCTSKADGKNTILYLHVFNWPENGVLVVPGITNKIKKAFLLDGGKKLKADRNEADINITVPTECPDKINTVIVLEVIGKPVVFDAPAVEPASGIFIGEMNAAVKDLPEGLAVHYTLDGTVPELTSPEYVSPVNITAETSFKAAFFLDGKRVGAVAERDYKKVEPSPATEVEKTSPGLKYLYYEGNFNVIPKLSSLKAVSEGVIPEVSVVPDSKPEYFAQSLSGYLRIPEDGVYLFSLMSDDGSRLFIDDRMAVDNDGLHSAITKSVSLPLAKGYHKVMVEFIQNTGGRELKLMVIGPQGEVNLKDALVH